MANDILYQFLEKLYTLFAMTYRANVVVGLKCVLLSHNFTSSQPKIEMVCALYCFIRYLSENRRMYGRTTSATRRAGLDYLAGEVSDVMEKSREMKKEGTTSHVFRAGDYNGIGKGMVHW